MPDSITGLLIIIIAIFPGLLGDRIYQSLVGTDWREKEFRSIIRLIGFSVVGVVLYTVIADLFNFPPPLHLLPSTYASISSTTESFNKIFFPYIGHLCGGLFAGIFASFGAWVLAKFSSSSVFPSAWDDFVRTYAPKHWVIVGLKNGEAYAGKLKTANVAVSNEDRDIVLEEPCLYEKSTGNYKALNYQYLFISSDNLFSLAAIHDPMIDKRIVPIGEYLFKGDSQDEHPQDTTDSTT